MSSKAENSSKISRRRFLLATSGIASGFLLPNSFANAALISSSSSLADAANFAITYFSERTQNLDTSRFDSFKKKIHPDSKDLQNTERDRASSLANLPGKNQWNGIFDSVSSSPQVLSVSQLGNQVQVLVQDWVAINWRPAPATFPIVRTTQELNFVKSDPIRYGLGVSAYTPTISGFGTVHNLLLEQANGQWVVVQDGYFEPVLGIKSQSYSKLIESQMMAQISPTNGTENLRVVPAPDLDPNPASAENLTSIFNYQAAVAYAQKWAKSYNPAYKNFAASGTDCANFVSQALVAGGHIPSATWNFSPSFTYAWDNNVGLRNWLISSGRGHDETVGLLGLADCVNYAWNTPDSSPGYDHIAIVTNIVAGIPQVSCHTLAELNVPYNAVYGSTYAPNQTREYTGTWLYYSN